MALPSPTDKLKLEELEALISTASIWITSDYFELAKKYSLHLIKIPGIYFSAYHPDLCYAIKKSSKELTSIHYNSKIAAWAYNNNIKIE